MGRAQGVPRWIRRDSGSFDSALGGRGVDVAPGCCSQSAGSFRPTSTDQLRLFEPDLRPQFHLRAGSAAGAQVSKWIHSAGVRAALSGPVAARSRAS
jgi:hypothetical protein